MHTKLLSLGLILGGFSIILGAFASHGLEGKIDADSIATFETGARYQMYQALFLIAVSFYKPLKAVKVKILFWLSLVGVIFFSGSIYGLATDQLTSFSFKSIAFITPIGGLLIISAWFFSAFTVLKK